MDDSEWHRLCQYRTQNQPVHGPDPAVWGDSLFPWQRATLHWMALMDRTPRQEMQLERSTNLAVTAVSDAPGGLIASAVGTGKTAVAVTYILERATPAHPVLVVVPRQVEQQWVDEFERVGATAGRPVSVQRQRIATKRKRESTNAPSSSTDAPSSSTDAPSSSADAPSSSADAPSSSADAPSSSADAPSSSADAPSSSAGAPCVVWRCMTVPASRKPPPGWCVMLVTYTFVERRFEALRGNSTIFDYEEWVRVAPGYCAQHGLETAFHDRRWGAIVYDEVEDGIHQHPLWLHGFLNTIPTDHVWALSSTPVSFRHIGRFLRLRREGPVTCTHTGEDVTVLMALNGVDLWPGMVMARSIRYSKEVMSHVRVRHRVANLELGATERDVLGFMASQGDFRRNALVCTDVAALMANLVAQRRAREGGRDEEVDMEQVVSRITPESFWQFMSGDVSARLQEARANLASLTAAVAEARMLVQALADGPTNATPWGPQSPELTDLRRRVTNLEARAKTAQSAVARFQAQDGYITGLRERVREAETNPCPICMDTIAEGDMAVTPCTHMFCVGCVLPWVTTHRKCPMCRQVVQPRDVKVLAGESPEAEVMPQEAPPMPQEADVMPQEGHLVNYSTKIRFLITQLRVLCSQTPDKAIVFCDYPKTATTIQEVLTAEGIHSTDLTGSLHTKNRKLGVFKQVDECRVLFLHTQTQNSGMDLFNANHIFFVNPVLSNDVVQQAVGRCVRLSQRKDVNVTFLTVPQVEDVPDLRAALGPFYEEAAAIVIE